MDDGVDGVLLVTLGRGGRRYRCNDATCVQHLQLWGCWFLRAFDCGSWFIGWWINCPAGTVQTSEFEGIGVYIWEGLRLMEWLIWL